MNVKLSGLNLHSVSCALPSHQLKISDLYHKFGQKEVDRIAMSTGIYKLGQASNNVKASDLCTSAAEHLFNRCVNRSEIDGIIFVSQTPDFIMPATSCLLQNRLGLRKDIVAFDINYGCSGYIYGLYQAALLVSSKSCNKVLLCVGDTITQYIDPDDHKLRLVLGDAGSASIIESGNDVWSFNIQTDGSGFDKLIIPKKPDNSDDYLFMDGSAIMEFALREVHLSVHQALNLQGWQKNDLSHVLLHQANEFMLNYLRKKMQLDKAKVPVAVNDYGNTGSASIPLTLSHYANQSPNPYGKSILAGFGVGLSWGTVALNLSTSIFYQPITHHSEESIC